MLSIDLRSGMGAEFSRLADGFNLKLRPFGVSGILILGAPSGYAMGVSKLSARPEILTDGLEYAPPQAAPRNQPVPIQRGRLKSNVSKSLGFRRSSATWAPPLYCVG